MRFQHPTKMNHPGDLTRKKWEDQPYCVCLKRFFFDFNPQWFLIKLIFCEVIWDPGRDLQALVIRTLQHLVQTWENLTRNRPDNKLGGNNQKWLNQLKWRSNAASGLNKHTWWIYQPKMDSTGINVDNIWGYLSYGGQNQQKGR